MDILLYIMAGAGVGLAVGLTGVGGGSLMTPLLMLFGFPPHIAVGTDLLYAAVTKAGGVATHHKQRTINWRVTRLLAAGSLPASALTVLLLSLFFTEPDSYRHLLTTSLGFMLIMTAAVLLYKKRLKTPEGIPATKLRRRMQQHKEVLTWAMGVLLGIFVTLSSVGAGAFGAAILMVLFPHLKAINIIGTDLAHAVPLTLIAGLGHLYLGNVDFALLGALLIGSLPAIYLGTRLSTRLPDRIMQPLLSSMLLGLGIKYAFF